MADTNVRITGSEEGALVAALSGLPPWATEDTAVQIEKYLRKSLDVQTKGFKDLIDATKKAAGAGGQGAAQQKAVNDALDKYLKNLKEANEEAEKKKKRQEKDKKDERDKDGRTKKEKATSEAITKVLGGLVSIGTKVLGVQKQYFETSNDLFKAGINLVSGQAQGVTSMQSLNEIITLTGVRLETFQKIVEKYTSSINAVGVVKFAKTITETNKKMQGLGYSTEEQIELLGTLVESESSYADIRNKSTTELADDAAKLGNQLNKMSMLTGLSNAKLQENIKALAKNNDSTVVSAVYGEKAAERMNTFASSFKDADIGQMFQRLASATEPVLTKTYQDLAKSGGGELAQELTRIAQAARDGSISIEDGVKQATARAQKIDSGKLRDLSLFADANVEGAQEQLSIITKLRAQGNTLSKATEPQVDAAVKSQAALSAFSSELERSRAQMQKAFPLLEEQVLHAANAMNTYNNALDKLTNTVSANTRSWIGIGLEVVAGLVIIGTKLSSITAIFSEVPGMLGKAFSALRAGAIWVGEGIMTLLNPIAKLTAAFAVGYGIGTILSNVLSKFDWFNNAMDNIFAGLDHIIQYIPGIGGDAKDRIAAREKVAALAGNSPVAKKGEISVPKTPMQSQIASPSAVSVTPPSGQPAGATATPQASDAAVGSGIEKPAKNADINSLLAYQNSVSEQVLLGIQSLVSVNKDILKYSRISA